MAKEKRRYPKSERIEVQLDELLEVACKGVFKARQVRGTGQSLDSREPAVLASGYGERFNESLLKLVFIADAKARLADNYSDFDEDLAWVPPARLGFTALGRQSGYNGIKGFENSWLFSLRGIERQAELHQEMADLRNKHVDPTLLSPWDQYVAHVALGEIYLPLR